MSKSEKRFAFWDGVPNVVDGALHAAVNCKFTLQKEEENYVPPAADPDASAGTRKLVLSSGEQSKVVLGADARVRIKQVDDEFVPVEELLTISLKARPVSSKQGKETSLLLRIYELSGSEPRLVYQEAFTGHEMRRMRTTDPRASKTRALANPAAAESAKKATAAHAEQPGRFRVCAWVSTEAQAFARVTEKTSLEAIEALPDVFGNKAVSTSGKAHPDQHGVNETSTRRKRPGTPARDWSGAQIRPAGAGSSPVFIATLPDSKKWVVKKVAQRTALADEVFFGRLIREAGIATADYVLPDREEIAALKAKLSDKSDCDVVMSFAPGHDITPLKHADATDLSGDNQKVNFLDPTLLHDLGKTVAFQVFMAGHDRFPLPLPFSMTTNAGISVSKVNTDNIRLNADGTKVVAIDNTCADRELGETFAAYLPKATEVLADTLFEGSGGDPLSFAVAEFLGRRKKLGPAPRALIRAGALDEAVAIGAIAQERIAALSAAVVEEVRAGIGPRDFSEGNVVGKRAVLENLGKLRAVFGAVGAAWERKKRGAPTLLEAALFALRELRGGGKANEALVTQLAPFEAQTGGMASWWKTDWPEELRQAAADKIVIKKALKAKQMLTVKAVQPMLDNAYEAGLPLFLDELRVAAGLLPSLPATHNNLLGHFVRTAAKMIVRLQRAELRPERTPTQILDALITKIAQKVEADLKTAQGDKTAARKTSASTHLKALYQAVPGYWDSFKPDRWNFDEWASQCSSTAQLVECFFLGERGMPFDKQVITKPKYTEPPMQLQRGAAWQLDAKTLAETVALLENSEHWVLHCAARASGGADSSHCFVIVRDGDVLKHYQGNAAQYSILDGHNRGAASVRDILAPLVDAGGTSRDLYAMDGVSKLFRIYWEGFAPSEAYEEIDARWRTLSQS